MCVTRNHGPPHTYVIAFCLVACALVLFLFDVFVVRVRDNIFAEEMFQQFQQQSSGLFSNMPGGNTFTFGGGQQPQQGLSFGASNNTGSLFGSTSGGSLFGGGGGGGASLFGGGSSGGLFGNGGGGGTLFGTTTGNSLFGGGTNTGGGLFSTTAGGFNPPPAQWKTSSKSTLKAVPAGCFGSSAAPLFGNAKPVPLFGSAKAASPQRQMVGANKNGLTLDNAALGFGAARKKQTKKKLASAASSPSLRGEGSLASPSRHSAQYDYFKLLLEATVELNDDNLASLLVLKKISLNSPTECVA